MTIQLNAIQAIFDLSRFRHTRCVHAFISGLAISCFCTPVSADDNVVSLNFDWPVGLQGTIENYTNYADTTEIDGDHGVQTESIWKTIRFTVSEQPDGLQFDYDVMKSSYHPEPDKETVEKQLWQLAYTTIPSHVVSTEGEFVGLTKEQEMLDKVSKEVDEKYGDSLNKIPEHILSELGSMFQSDYYWAISYHNWERDIGQWISTEMIIGRDYERDGIMEIPFIENTELPYQTTTTLLGFLPCDAKPGDEESEYEGSSNGSESASCVEIEVASELDENAVAEFVKGKNKESGTDPQTQWKPKRYHKLNLITDPDTLIPYAVSEIDVLSLEVDGFPVIIHQQVIKNTYSYEF